MAQQKINLKASCPYWQQFTCGARFTTHNQDSDRGKASGTALVVISLTNSMTQTHALFLEWFAIAEATKAGRYSLENGNTGSLPYTPLQLQADCHEIHQGGDGVGKYTTEGFVVLKGSKGRLETVASLQGRSGERFREKLTESYVMAANGKMLDELKRQTVTRIRIPTA